MSKKTKLTGLDGLTCDEADLASVLDLSTRRIRQLVDEGVVIRISAKTYDLPASVRGYIRRMGSGDESYEADKARKMKADADCAELEAAKAAGKLIDSKAAGKAWENAIEVASIRLNSLGQNLGPRVVIAESAKAATDLINEAVRSACQSLYEVEIDKEISGDPVS